MRCRKGEREKKGRQEGKVIDIDVESERDENMKRKKMTDVEK